MKLNQRPLNQVPTLLAGTSLETSQPLTLQRRRNGASQGGVRRHGADVPLLAGVPGHHLCGLQAGIRSRPEGLPVPEKPTGLKKQAAIPYLSDSSL